MKSFLNLTLSPRYVEAQFASDSDVELANIGFGSMYRYLSHMGIPGHRQKIIREHK